MRTERIHEWLESEQAWLQENLKATRDRPVRIDYDQTSFPRSVRTDRPLVEWILDDLCALLDVGREFVLHEYFHDARDIHGMPLQFIGLTPPSELIVKHQPSGERIFIIQLANAVRSDPRRLLKQCIYELVAAKLIMGGAQLGVRKGIDYEQRIEAAAVFLGFGWILAHGRNEVNYKVEAGWVRRSNHRSPLPHSTFAHAMALYATHHGMPKTELLRGLPNEISGDVKEALAWQSDMRKETGNIRSPAEQVFSLLRDSSKACELGDFDAAIELATEALGMTTDPGLLSVINNNIGYAYSCMGHFDRSITYFEKATELDPDYAYPYDNMGFSLIMIGALEKGKSCLERAMGTGGNDPGYSHRNMGLYHWRRAEMEAADGEFLEAFDNPRPVDFLNAIYSQFLKAKGDPEMAEVYEDLADGEGELPFPEWARSITAVHPLD